MVNGLPTQFIQAHALWVPNGLAGERTVGLLQFKDNALTFSDLSGNELVRVEGTQIRNVSLTQGKGTFLVIHPIESAEKRLCFTFLGKISANVYGIDSASRQPDNVGYYQWIKAFKQANIKASTNTLLYVSIIVVFAILVALFIAKNKTL